MSFLKDINPQTFGTAMNGIAKAGGADPGYAAPAAASVPMSPTTQFGTAMNGVASAGGATPGYAAQPINNHLQFLDPTYMEALMRRLGGQSR